MVVYFLHWFLFGRKYMGSTSLADPLGIAEVGKVFGDVNLMNVGIVA